MRFIEAFRSLKIPRVSWVELMFPSFFLPPAPASQVMKVRMTFIPWVISAESRTQGWPQLSTSRPWDAKKKVFLWCDGIEGLSPSPGGRRDGKFQVFFTGKMVDFPMGYVSLNQSFLFETHISARFDELLEPSEFQPGCSFLQKEHLVHKWQKGCFFVDPWHFIRKLQNKFL